MLLSVIISAAILKLDRNANTISSPFERDIAHSIEFVEFDHLPYESNIYTGPPKLTVAATLYIFCV